MTAVCDLRTSARYGGGYKLGIVAFSATHNENRPQEQTVFATVGNFGTAD